MPHLLKLAFKVDTEHRPELEDTTDWKAMEADYFSILLLPSLLERFFLLLYFIKPCRDWCRRVSKHLK
jgi:hypothetical protein